jgi:small subunit ribosomal protein S2
VTMSKLPDALIVIDPNKNKVAINEAIKLGIPVISFIDQNFNTSPLLGKSQGITYPISVSGKSIRFIYEYLVMIFKLQQSCCGRRKTLI